MWRHGVKGRRTPHGIRRLRRTSLRQTRRGRDVEDGPFVRLSEAIPRQGLDQVEAGEVGGDGALVVAVHLVRVVLDLKGKRNGVQILLFAGGPPYNWRIFGCFEVLAFHGFLSLCIFLRQKIFCNKIQESSASKKSTSLIFFNIISALEFFQIKLCGKKKEGEKDKLQTRSYPEHICLAMRRQRRRFNFSPN